MLQRNPHAAAPEPSVFQKLKNILIEKVKIKQITSKTSSILIY